MEFKLIKKKPSRPPNLDDVDTARHGFSYEKYTAELVWFDRTHFNAAYNVVTRNAMSSRKNKVALYWLGETGVQEKYTFLEMDLLSNQIANYLKSLGVEKNDRVFIFLPRVPQLFFSFLATLKLGAVAGTMFSAFQQQALFDRLDQSDAKVIITNRELAIRLKEIRHKLPHLETVILIDEDFPKELPKQSSSFSLCKTEGTDDAFMLYTSGTTGKPKGVVHQHKALLHEYLTAKWVLDIDEDDVYWCTADPGWVTGIAYEILGTWAAGASTVVYEGRFDPGAWYKILADYKVNVWYTAPTAIRMLASSGADLVKKYDLSALRHILSVGEPLNPEMVVWSDKVFGLPFHDTYWQTETGGIVMANYLSLAIKPGSMGKPFPGMKAHIIDDKGNPVSIGEQGLLSFEPNWPSLMKKIWRRPEKYDSYFIHSKKLGKLYLTGDLAYVDRDGYFWFVGRADDVIKTSGERVGPFEVESALVGYPGVVEAGVIGKPDAVRGEIIKAFVVLNEGIKPSEKLKQELSEFVKKNLAGHAYPREIEFIDKLPKTRSGKIMRRILKAREMGLPVGDTSTLEEY